MNDKMQDEPSAKVLILYPCPICGEKIPVTHNTFAGAPLICPDCHAIFALEITLVCE